MVYFLFFIRHYWMVVSLCWGCDSAGWSFFLKRDEDRLPFQLKFVPGIVSHQSTALEQRELLVISLP